MTTAKWTATGPTIHVVDDDESFRTAVTRVLRAAEYEVRDYGSAGDFLMRRPESGPGCVLLDMQMPGPSGLDLQEALSKSDDSLPIIFLSGHGSIPATVRAMKAGAVDFLTKPVKRERLLCTIEKALAQDAEARTNREKLRGSRTLYESLTPREQEVLKGVVGGKPNKEIAAELGIAERTVKAHRGHVMEKMRAGSVVELVRIADRLPGRMDGGAARPQL